MQAHPCHALQIAEMPPKKKAGHAKGRGSGDSTAQAMEAMQRQLAEMQIRQEKQDQENNRLKRQLESSITVEMQVCTEGPCVPFVLHCV